MSLTWPLNGIWVLDKLFLHHVVGWETSGGEGVGELFFEHRFCYFSPTQGASLSITKL